MSRTAAIARNDLTMLVRDATAPIILVVMPVVIIAFFKPAWAPVLRSEGYPLANGAEQAVPGTAVMVSVFMVNYAGLGFFREFVWATWDRLRSMPVKPVEVMVGKITPIFLLLTVQQVLLF